MGVTDLQNREGVEIMDLRDHFAAAVLVGLLSNSRHPLEPTENSLIDERGLATCAYRIADFMMAEREPKEENFDVQPV